MATVMVVDTDRKSAAVTRSELEKAGHRVLVARDGLSAMDMIEDEEPDVLVTIVSVAGVELDDLLRKASNHDTGIVVQTNHGRYPPPDVLWLVDSVVKKGNFTELRDEVGKAASLHAGERAVDWDAVAMADSSMVPLDGDDIE